MIEIDGLTKRYKNRTVVDSLTFNVQPGVVTGFLGPNGAGKSTTMRMLLGLSYPDAGTAKINHQTYRNVPSPLKHVGALVEDASPHKDLTAERHLQWLAATSGVSRVRVNKVLEQVGLTEARKRRSGTFSLGMGQRLGLAAALLCEPSVLVLDEPTNGLDPEGIRWMRNLFRHLASEGRTVFISSHLMSEMALTADHLVVINNGKLLSNSSTEEFVQTHGGTVVRVRVQNPIRLAEALHIAGYAVTSEPDGSLNIEGSVAAEVRTVAAEIGEPLTEINTQSTSLEDAFFRVVEGNNQR